MLDTNSVKMSAFFQFLVPTPVAEVRRDYEKVRRICQVFAEQPPIFLLLRLTQSTHKHRNNAELIFVAAKSD